MRKLVFLGIGVAAACGLCAYGADLRIWLLAGGALLLAVFLGSRASNPWKRISLVLLGGLVGFCWFDWYHAEYVAPAAGMDGKTCYVELRAADYSTETDYGSVFAGTLILDGKSYQVRTYLKDFLSVSPGNYVYGTFRFRATVPEGAEGSDYHTGKGIFLLAYQADAVSVVDYPPTRRDIPARIRRKIDSILANCFSAEAYPFAKALLIGDVSSLDYKTNTDFKLSGIRHVVAVSGLHVSIVFSVLSALTFRKRWLTALIAFPTLCVFAAVAGFTPSVNRACIMCGLMLLAMLVNREYDGPSALSFAVLVILAWNPYSITSVSLQLSVSAIVGIYLFDPTIRKWLMSHWGEGRGYKARLRKGVSGSMSVSLSVLLLTAPLSAYYFGTVSLVGVVTNLLTLWVVGMVFCGVAGVCLLYFWMPAAGNLLAKLIALPIDYVLKASEWMAGIPMAAVYTQNPYITAWMVFMYILLMFFLCSQNRRPMLLSCCGVLGLCLALLAGWMEPLTADLSFTVLDVGQGQCLLIQTEGKNFLVDCGGDSDEGAADLAAETLLSQGISRLDALILTHLDRDHGGGAKGLLSRIDTELLILPAQASELSFLQPEKTIFVTEDLFLTGGNTNISIFAPTFPGNSNEMSLCILFDTEKCDILVTGDRTGFGERVLLRNADIPDVDILVAGHHGSKNSTCEELLAAVRPEIVCISVGADNSYGHPAPELLERLQEYGCTVYRTDLHGSITIRR